MGTKYDKLRADIQRLEKYAEYLIKGGKLKGSQEREIEKIEKDINNKLNDLKEVLKGDVIDYIRRAVESIKLGNDLAPMLLEVMYKKLR